MLGLFFRALGPNRAKVLDLGPARCCIRQTAGVGICWGGSPSYLSPAAWARGSCGGLPDRYVDGSPLETLPENGPTRDALTQLGVLNGDFQGCLVVPLEQPDE